MHKDRQKVGFRITSVLILLFVASVGFALEAGVFKVHLLQESLPTPPADRTLIYHADEKGVLSPLALEAGSTPLNVEMVARGDKRSYLELAGGNSATVITNIEPRFYIFLQDEASPKPPLIVRLTEKRGARRVSAMAQKGFKGFAIDSNEIIKPHYRVLGREGGMIFMEIRSREPLMHGEYAIIGSDVTSLATFRIAAASNP